MIDQPWGLGGGGLINAQGFCRVSRSDWDTWKESTGEEWSDQMMGDVFSKVENCDLHGSRGPVPIQRAVLPGETPETDDEHVDLKAVLREEYDKLGTTWNEDMNVGNTMGTGSLWSVALNGDHRRTPQDM